MTRDEGLIAFGIAWLTRSETFLKMGTQPWTQPPRARGLGFTNWREHC
jgi:hypothetical protein